MTSRKVSDEFATTDELMAAAGVVRRTIQQWTKAGLLPAPTFVSLGNPHGAFHRYPAWAVEQVKWIMSKRKAGHTLKEIKAMLDARPVDTA